MCGCANFKHVDALVAFNEQKIIPENECTTPKISKSQVWIICYTILQKQFKSFTLITPTLIWIHSWQLTSSGFDHFLSELFATSAVNVTLHKSKTSSRRAAFVDPAHTCSEDNISEDPSFDLTAANPLPLQSSHHLSTGFHLDAKHMLSDIYEP